MCVCVHVRVCVYVAVRMHSARTSARYVTCHPVKVLASLPAMTSQSTVAKTRSSCTLTCTAYFRSTSARAPHMYSARVSVSLESANLFR